MHFDAPKDRAAAAFGPLAEARWASHFRPRFVFPQPAAEVSGAVFKTSDGKLWLLHDFDPAAGLVQYVIVEPASEATTLTIRSTAEKSGTAVTMTYDMVGIDDAGRTHVVTIEKHARELAEHIQDAVTTYLASGAAPSAG